MKEVSTLIGLRKWPYGRILRPSTIEPCAGGEIAVSGEFEMRPTGPAAHSRDRNSRIRQTRATSEARIATTQTYAFIDFFFNFPRYA